MSFSGRKVWFLLHCPCDERARVEVFRDLPIQLRELRGIVGFEQAAAHIAELAHGDALGIRYGKPSEKRLSGSSRLSFFSATNWEKDANDERLCIATDAEVIS